MDSAGSCDRPFAACALFVAPSLCRRIWRPGWRMLPGMERSGNVRNSQALHIDGFSVFPFLRDRKSYYRALLCDNRCLGCLASWGRTSVHLPVSRQASVLCSTNAYYYIILIVYLCKKYRKIIGMRGLEFAFLFKAAYRLPRSWVLSSLPLPRSIVSFVICHWFRNKYFWQGPVTWPGHFHFLCFWCQLISIIMAGFHFALLPPKRYQVTYDNANSIGSSIHYLETLCFLIN